MKKLSSKTKNRLIIFLISIVIGVLIGVTLVMRYD